MSKGTSARGRILSRGLMVYKAQSLAGQDVPDLILSATKAVPDFKTKTLADNQALLLNDAQMIVAALEASLPGGTLDRITALLMLHKCSGLVVREQDISGGRGKKRVLQESRNDQSTKEDRSRERASHRD